jgi:hypothetical protein
MDLAAIRSGLPSMTRALFGDKVTILPMIEGKMGPAVVDPARVEQVDVKARFDFAPDLEKLGGGDRNDGHAFTVSPHASVSFARADLSWLPGQGDQIRHDDDRYRIDRPLEPLPAVLLCLISRIS